MRSFVLVLVFALLCLMISGCYGDPYEEMSAVSDQAVEARRKAEVIRQERDAQRALEPLVIERGWKVIEVRSSFTMQRRTQEFYYSNGNGGHTDTEFAYEISPRQIIIFERIDGDNTTRESVIYPDTTTIIVGDEFVRRDGKFVPAYEFTPPQVEAEEADYLLEEVP